MSSVKCHIATKHITAHFQSHESDEVDVGSPKDPVKCNRNSTALIVQNEDNCKRTLISLLDRALSQNVPIPSHQFQGKFYKVCRSYDHATGRRNIIIYFFSATSLGIVRGTAQVTGPDLALHLSGAHRV